MSCSLRIQGNDTEKAVWFPSSWVFENIFNYIQQNLQQRNKKLAEKIDKSVILGYMGNISSMSIDEFNSIQRLVNVYFEEQISKITKSMISTSTFDEVSHLIFQTCQLRAMLNLDGRSRSKDKNQCYFIMKQHKELELDSWLFNLILELLGSTVHQTSISKSILKARFPNQSIFDFTNLDKAHYTLATNSIGNLSEYFKETEKGRVAFSTNMTPILSITLKKLHLMMQDD